MRRLELFGAFLKLGPLLVLKASLKPDAWWLTVAIVLSVTIGGAVSLLVLGEVLPITALTRWIVVVAACLSLALLALRMVRGIAEVYRIHRAFRENRAGEP